MRESESLVARDPATRGAATRMRVMRVLEPLVLVATPVAAAFIALSQVQGTALLTLALVIGAILFVTLGVERSEPRLRQIMPVVVLAAVAAVGRMLFAPIPDVKPVTAIIIVAGTALGARAGFSVGALAALVSNFYFGQGAWTPLQMYAWGLVGYLAGVLAQCGVLRGLRSVCAYGFLSALLYGCILNGWHVLGFVRPLTWQGTLLAYGAGFPLDVLHGTATVAFLLAIWKPWTRQIRRIVAKFGL